MHGDEHPVKRALRDRREQILEGLSVAFAQDEISLEEFERRVDAAFVARDLATLDALVVDLSSVARRALESVSVVGNGHELRPAHGRGTQAELVLGQCEP